MDWKQYANHPDMLRLKETAQHIVDHLNIKRDEAKGEHKLKAGDIMNDVLYFLIELSNKH